MTHEEIMKLRENPTGTHAWDFTFSEGDTIKEKYESLHEIVLTLVLDKNESKRRRLVFANLGAASGLIVSADLNNETETVPFYKDVAVGVRHLARFERKCGTNGYCANFELYQDEAMPNDEILVINGDDRKIIKLYNFIF